MIFSSDNVNDVFQKYKITWEYSTSDFMQKKYKLEFVSYKIHVTHIIYFIDLSPCGRGNDLNV